MCHSSLLSAGPVPLTAHEPHLCNLHPPVSNAHLQCLIFPDTTPHHTAPHQHREPSPETLQPPSITLTDPGDLGTHFPMGMTAAWLLEGNAKETTCCTEHRGQGQASLLQDLKLQVEMLAQQISCSGNLCVLVRNSFLQVQSLDITTNPTQFTVTVCYKE